MITLTSLNNSWYFIKDWVLHPDESKDFDETLLPLWEAKDIILAERNRRLNLSAADLEIVRGIAESPESGGGGVVTPGVSDHSALTGLQNDDHTQYLNNSRGDLRYYKKAQVDSIASSKADINHIHDNVTTSSNGFMSSVDKVKLDSISPNATVNSTDAYLLDRVNHTGTQSVSTITGLANVATSGSSSDVSEGSNLFFTETRVKNTVIGDVIGDNSPLVDTDNLTSYLKKLVGADQNLNSSKINVTEKGAADGVTPLGSDQKVPSQYLPSYVDDVLEFSSFSNFPVAGESSKIYISTDDNLTYRWSGTQYTEVSKSLALGETASTAYAGDRGKAAYDHTFDVENPHAVTKTQVGLGNVQNVDTTTTSNINDSNDKRFLTEDERTKIATLHTNNTGVNTGDETKGTIESKLGAASSTNNGYLSNTDYVSFNNKEPAVASGTVSDYYRGDKSFRPLDVAAVTGLQAALDTKEPNIIATTASDYYAGDKTFKPLTKGSVGLSDVPNTDATQRANHTGTQVASTISDFTAASNLVIDSRISDAVSDGEVTKAPTQNAVFDALGTKANSVHTHTTSQITDYNTVTDNKINLAISNTVINTLADVDTVGASSGQYLTYNGSNWIPSTLTIPTQGDMYKATYDTNNNGVVDDSERLNNQLPAFYLDRTNHTGTQSKNTVGLDQVDNTSDATKPVSTPTQTALDGKANTSHTHVISDVTNLQPSLDSKINTSLIGVANGIAPLGADQRVPAINLPAYVDDIEEFATMAEFPVTGVANLLYLALDTNTLYRWSGTTYSPIGSSLALGETSSTAYPGDKGKTAFDHTTRTDNPHNVDKAQVGLSNVDNTADANKNVLSATKLTTARNFSASGDTEAPSVAFDGISNVNLVTTIGTGVVTNAKLATVPTMTIKGRNAAETGTVLDLTVAQVKAMLALDQVNNTSDANKPISTAQQTALNNKLNTSEKGAVNGVAPLGADQRVPAIHLPAYVDDVQEFSTFSELPPTGSSGVVYLTLDTNKLYRWGGSSYGSIADSVALGETSSTAYAGDKGKIAYDHSQITAGNPHGTTKADIGLGNVPNLDTSTTANITDSTDKRFITDATLASIANKQDTLVSGTNIKTVNSQSLVGSGNVEVNIIQSPDGTAGNLTIDNTGTATFTYAGNIRQAWKAGGVDMFANSGVPYAFRFKDGAGTNHAGLRAPTTVTASYFSQLPDAIGTAGQLLTVTSVTGSEQTLGYSSIKTVNGNTLTGTGNVVIPVPKFWAGTATVAGTGGLASFTIPAGIFTAAPTITATLVVASGTAVQNLGGASIVQGTVTTTAGTVRAWRGTQTTVALGGSVVSMSNAPAGSVVHIMAIQY